VPLKDIFRQGGTSKDDLLMVELALLNTNPTRKVEYHSWSGRDISLDRHYATLKDNFGNSYRRINFGFSSHPVGAVERFESIYPNKSLTDILVFEVPLDTATHLDLEMPAKNHGNKGMIRFRIPMEWVSGVSGKPAHNEQKIVQDRHIGEAKPKTEAKAKPDPEAKAKRDTEEEAKAEEKAKRDAEERARAEERAKRDAEARAKREAEAKAKADQEAERLARQKSQKDENVAAARLALIKQLLEEKRYDVAKFRLERLVKEYPDTKAAAEARKMLKKL
jgi:hypothetical protein